VFVGRLHRQKDVPALIEAVAKMRTTGASLVVVGDGPERATVEAAVARHGLGARVHVTGFRPHREVPAFLAHADVFAMPSVYEELGSALVEAMHAGLPIVASDTGGIPDAVGPAAVLVPPGDPGALAGALDRLLADAEERARLSALARERAARFDWERLADEVLGAYGTALGAAPAAPRVAAPVPAGEPV
jgi:glycosyltransferase involved in cell wall biosynthesis